MPNRFILPAELLAHWSMPMGNAKRPTGRMLATFSRRRKHCRDFRVHAEAIDLVQASRR